MYVSHKSTPFRNGHNNYTRNKVKMSDANRAATATASPPAATRGLRSERTWIDVRSAARIARETTGAFAPGADSFLNKLTHDAEALQAAGGERTVYSTGNENFYTYHSRRISISIRSAVAERAANNHQKLRRRLTRATVVGRQWARRA